MMFTKVINLRDMVTTLLNQARFLTQISPTKNFRRTYLHIIYFYKGPADTIII